MKTGAMKSLFAATGVALAMGLGGIATAAPLALYPYTLIEDDNVDSFLLDANQNGILDLGDQLHAVLKFTKVASIPPGSNYAPTELTGYSEVEVVNKIPLGGGVFRIDFAPVAGFAALYGPGAMVALFEDPANNLNILNCVSVAACKPQAIDGNLWAVAGYQDPDDEWWSLGSDDIGAASIGNAGSKFATINFAQSLIVNNTGYTFMPQALGCALFACAGDGQTTLVGSSDILGGEGLDPGHVRSDTDVTLKTVPVPEPASLALIGIGLLAGVAGKRRRRLA